MSGPQRGTRLSKLVQKLVRGQVHPKDLEWTAVRFHGEVYVVEGNCRLWCLTESQKQLGQKIMVSVRGETYGHVYDKEKGYVDWCLKQQADRSATARKDFCNHIRG